MEFGLPFNYQHIGNGENIAGSSENLKKRIEDLMKWQQEQQNLLKQEKTLQILHLREEQRNIQDMFRRKKAAVVDDSHSLSNPQLREEHKDGANSFRRKKVQNCQSPVHQLKTNHSAFPLTPSRWNTLVKSTGSPSQRIERADQLKNFLKNTDVKLPPEDRFIADMTNLEVSSTHSSNESESVRINHSISDSDFDKSIHLKEDSNSINPPSISSSNCNYFRTRRKSCDNRADSESTDSKFKFLRKGQSLTKYKIDKMKNPELCLGIKGVPNVVKEKHSQQISTESSTCSELQSESCKSILKQSSCIIATEGQGANSKSPKRNPIQFYLVEHCGRENRTDDENEIVDKSPKVLKGSPLRQCKESPSRSMGDRSLREFEILERAAEETSFSSSSSIVVKAMHFNTFQDRCEGRMGCKMTSIFESEDETRQPVTENNENKLIAIDKALNTSSKNLIRDDDSNYSQQINNFQDEFSWVSTSEYLSSPSHTVESTDIEKPLSNIGQNDKRVNRTSSDLVTRYFSNLKSKDTLRISHSESEENQRKAVVSSMTDLQHKMKELEQEINHFRVENSRLVELIIQQKAMQKELEIQKKSFETYKHQEQERLSQFLEAERNKVKKERELYNAYLKTRPKFDQQERKELAKLQTEVGNVRAILRSRESKWSAAEKRLQDRIVALEDEKASLKSELSRVEKKNRELIQTITNTSEKTTPSGLTKRSISSLQGISTKSSVTEPTLPFKISGSEPKLLNKLPRPEPRPSNMSPGLESRLSTMSPVLESRSPNTSPSIEQKLMKMQRSETRSPNVSPLQEQKLSKTQRPLNKLQGSKLKLQSKLPKPEQTSPISLTALIPLSLNIPPESKLASKLKLTTNLKEELNNLAQPLPTLPTVTINSNITASLHTTASSYTGDSFSSVWTDSFTDDAFAPSNPEQLSHVDNFELFRLNPKLTLVKSTDTIVSKIMNEDGSFEKQFANGTREIVYLNKTRKQFSVDGKTVMVFLFNGDIKHIYSDDKIVYYFAANQTTHTTYPDGLQVYHFANNQLEKHYPDGSKQINFADRSVKFIYIDGSEESITEDGTRVAINAKGDCMMQFANGQKEIHTKEYKKRIFSDGTIKILYPDGTLETRYSNGRVRIKNKDGKLIVDQ